LRSKTTTLVGLVSCVLLAAGCQSARVTKPAIAEFGGSDPDAQIDFWHALASRSLTSNDDAMHAMLLYLDDKDDCATYADRVAELKKRRLLHAGFDSPADEAVRRGTVAVMFANALHLRGGWAMHIFGSTPRYALRELQYLAIFPYSSPQQTFSGTEFVGVIGALEDYQNAHGSGSKPAIPAPVAPPPTIPNARNGSLDAQALVDLAS